ncbi:MAG: methyltransferase domain-containing protein [Proteobacteria bacterium]|nr:methyltransferase domain-containing protein [Pseudomonadota bacterium]
METALFNKFCSIAYAKAGISLNEGKEALVTARVAKRQRVLKLGTPREYLHYLEEEKTGEELVYFLDSISTNFTNFMREKDHFNLLTKEVRQWIASGRQMIRLWCAASSSGEEPYSMAITILDTLDDKAMDFKILATDISTKVLNSAKKGVYDSKSVEPLTKAQRIKHFSRITPRSADEALFEVKPEVKRHIVFKRLNLSTPPFPMQGPLDAVFCRNVMIYFDNRVRQGLISEIERLLQPGGFLVTGHSETLAGISSSFKMLRPSVYMKPMADEWLA